MIAINVDSAKNTILVKIAGAISAEQTTKAVIKLFEVAPKMKENFSVINDISGLLTISAEQSETLNKVNQKLLNTYKINKIIRVVGKSRDVLIQLSVSDKRTGLKNVIYVPTMKEAIQLL
ncbi:MAG: hypothetical protein KDF60_17405 [Calditrichaeota bacterium]|nr:hypothetical protein [Calditrichota bacterium]